MTKNLIIQDKYRKNPLSLEPGGHDVTVLYADGFSQTYDKVKSPKAFIAKISDGNRRKVKIVGIFVDGKPFSR
jgi:hypothetical protein